MKLKNAIKLTGFGSIATAIALASVVNSTQANVLKGFDKERASVHTEFSSYNISGFNDNGTMLVIGGGYEIIDNVTLKADYGTPINDAETTVSTFSGSTKVETGVTQLRGFVESSRKIGNSDFGYHGRAGVVNLDGDVTASSGDSSSTADISETNLTYGGGLNWEPDNTHRVSVNLDVPASDVSTISAGYDYQF